MKEASYLYTRLTIRFSHQTTDFNLLWSPWSTGSMPHQLPW